MEFGWTGRQLQLDPHWGCFTCDMWSFCMDGKQIVDGIGSFFGSAGKRATHTHLVLFARSGVKWRWRNRASTTSPNTGTFVSGWRGFHLQTTILHWALALEEKCPAALFRTHRSYCSGELEKVTWSRFALRGWITRVSSGGLRLEKNYWTKNESLWLCQQVCDVEKEASKRKTSSSTSLLS